MKRPLVKKLPLPPRTLLEVVMRLEWEREVNLRLTRLKQGMATAILYPVMTLALILLVTGMAMMAAMEMVTLLIQITATEMATGGSAKRSFPATPATPS